jgi:hypothetical protein
MKRTNNQQSTNPRTTVPNFQIRLHKIKADRIGEAVIFKIVNSEKISYET